MCGSLVGLIVGSISAAGSRGQFAFELLEEFFTRLGDGFGPEVSFTVIMERGLWGDSHGGAGRIRERRSVGCSVSQQLAPQFGHWSMVWRKYSAR